MKKMKGDEPSGPNMTFAEAGFDSLDSIELALFLQDELGVKIDETVLNNYPTFAALAGYLKERL
jgi:acyl carrier protein